MADIGIRGIRKTFDRGKVTAVRDVDLTVSDGEFFVLLGPSGSGKTTLLRIIAGLEFADAGTVTIGGTDVTSLPPRKRDLAMVFQNYAVFPHLTVRQNIGFGLRMKGEDKKTIAERTETAAELTELSEYLDRRPAQLSGGQRQRVGVARAVATEPAVLLMDEPLSNLDALLRLKFRSDLKRIVHELKTTTIYVTHDQVEALSLGDRMGVMRDGEIVQVDTPLNVYEHPADTFVGGFIGSPPMNFLPVTLTAGEGGAAQARVGEHAFAVSAGPGSAGPGSAGPGSAGLGDYAGKQVLAGIRGENVTPSATRQPGAVPGTVKVVEPLGAQLLITVTIEGTEFKIVAPNDFTATEDAELWLRPAPDKVRLFDRETTRAITPGGT